jgi:multidrug transporter EmrE-like cation transporter
MSVPLSTKIIFIILVTLAVSMEIVGDLFFKFWAEEHKSMLLAVGFLVYFIGTVFWAFSLKYEYLSRAISVFTILNLVVMALVGVLYFKEDLGLINKIGLGLGILSVVLIEI